MACFLPRRDIRGSFIEYFLGVGGLSWETNRALRTSAADLSEGLPSDDSPFEALFEPPKRPRSSLRIDQPALLDPS